MLEKTCFQRGFVFFRNISFTKKNLEGAPKKEIS